MEAKFECIMLAAFCAAIGLLFAEHIQHHFKADVYEQVTLILSEIGFAAGAFLRLQSTLEFAICYFGMLLTLTALLYTWPEKKKANSEVE